MWPSCGWTVDGPPLAPLSGAVFQAPVVGQMVFTLGYPKLPALRDASVTMQHGAVTKEEVTSLAETMICGKVVFVDRKPGAADAQTPRHYRTGEVAERRIADAAHDDGLEGIR